METWRVFVAVPLSDEAVHQLTSLMSEAKGFSGPGVRWTGEGNLHLTLRFLGEVPVKQLDLIKRPARRRRIVVRFSISRSPGRELSQVGGGRGCCGPV